MPPTTPTKLNPFPKAIVTPVAAARAHFKKEELAQTTITQWERDLKKEAKPPPSSPSSDSSSEDTDFEKKKSPNKRKAAIAKRNPPHHHHREREEGSDQNDNCKYTN